MLRKLLISTAMVCVVAAGVFARTPREASVDSLKNSHRVVHIGGGANAASPDSIHSIINDFYLDQFRQFDNPGAPYFMFMTKDAHMALGMGGTVRLRGWYDWGGSISGQAFSPYLINMNPDPRSIRDLDANPSGSNIFFRMIGRHTKIGHYQLYLEAEFSGYNGVDFSLKKAYATLNDWTIGYASTTFSDPQALPPSVDAQGPNNKMDATAVLVRYMHTFKPGIVLATSVENPVKQTAIDAEDAVSTTTWLPDLGFFLQYQWGNNSMQHIRFSAVTRQLTYRNLLTSTNHHFVGWGLQLSAVANICKPLTLYATVNGGRGMAGLGGDWIMNNFDLVRDPEKPGTLYAPEVFGFMASVQYHFRHNLFASLTWGQAHYFQKDGTPGSDYRYGLYGAANVFYNLTPRIQFGLGFNIGKRVNVDHTSRWGRRLCAVASFSF